jgi:hypothetical protein
MYQNELNHYGVLGMKWGVRRARRKQAKAAYRKSTDEAFKKYEREINSIEKNYKRGQKMSDRDYAREEAADRKYQAAARKAKDTYKKAKTDRSNDAAIANKLYSQQSKAANKRVAQMSTGEALLQSYLMGSYGALKYNEAKGRGTSTGKAVVEGVLKNWGNNLLGGVPGALQYLDNRSARKN